MLSVHRGHSTRYLTDEVATAREGYYTGAVVAGEPPGLWWGAGAETLGLRGEVDADLMEAIYTRLLDPRDPAAHNRDTWDEIRQTVSISLGLYHQFQTGYDSTLTLRFETIVMPWQNWSPVNYQDLIDGMAGNYGIYLYPEITWMLRSTWYATLQSIISPVDASHTRPSTLAMAPRFSSKGMPSIRRPS